MGTLRYQNPLWDPPFYYTECFLRELVTAGIEDQPFKFVTICVWTITV
jgi:hypothetical protein